MPYEKDFDGLIILGSLHLEKRRAGACPLQAALTFMLSLWRTMLVTKGNSPMKKRARIGALTGIALVFALVGVFAIIVTWQHHTELRAKAQVQAALASVSINSGSALVPDGTDITSSAVSLSPDLGAYRWTVNGNDLMALNVPFNDSDPQINFSSSGLNGTEHGSPTHITAGCKVGSCMTFDGVDDYVDFGEVSSVEGVSGFALSAWIKPAEYAQSTSTLDARGIVTKGAANGYGTSVFTTFFQGNGSSGYNFICGLNTTTDFPSVFLDAQTYFPLDTWTHFVCTWTSGGPTSVYVNGVLAGSTVNLGGTTLNTNNSLKIGFSDNSTDDKYKGDMDEVQIYLRGLSAAQITQIYNETKGSSQGASDGLGAPSVIKSDETTVGQLWDLYLSNVSSLGVVGSTVHSDNAITVGNLSVLSSTPTHQALDVSKSGNIVLVFNASLDGSTVNSTNLPVYGSYTGLIAGSYTLSTTNVANDTVTINPTTDFMPNEHVDVDISTNVHAVGGTGLATGQVRSYTVEVPSAGGQFTSLPGFSTTMTTVFDYGSSLGDFNNDNVLDLVVSPEGPDASEAVKVFQGNGDGTFTQVFSSPFNFNDRTWFIAPGDFNHDGNLDMALTSGNTSLLSIFIGNGSFGFSKATYPAVTGCCAYGLHVNDFNGDGIQDIAIPEINNNKMSILIGDGLGAFAAPVAYATNTDRMLTIGGGDLNNDFIDDLLGPGYSSSDISVLLGNGNGSFQTGVLNAASNNGQARIYVNDFNADGDLDVATQGSSGVTTFSNNGSATLSLVSTYNTGGSGLVGGDFDGDGDQDLVNNAGSGNLSLRLNDGSGGFSSQTIFALGNAAGSDNGVAGDVDGNGTLDLVKINAGDQKVYVLLNSQPTLAVSSLSPARNALNVSASSNIIVRFDHSLNTSTVNAATFIVHGDQSGKIAGAFSFSTTSLANDTVTFNPTNNFHYGELVTVSLTSSIHSSGAGVLIPQTYTFTAAVAAGIGTFGSELDYALSGSSALAVTAADFDNDGDADVAAAVSTGVDIFANNGSGVLAFNNTVATGAGTARSMVAQDLNGDGNMDLVKSASSLKVAVYLGNGDLTFQPAVTYATTYDVQSVTTSDFNNDGIPDIAAGTFDSGFPGNGHLVVWLGNGNGTFQAALEYALPSGGSYGIAAADFNNDGNMDLAGTTYFDKEVVVFLGDGTGGMTQHALISDASILETFMINAADYTGDGNIDLMFTDVGQNRSHLWTGNGTGSFSMNAYYVAISGNNRAADLDQDGDLDHYSSWPHDAHFKLLFNNGSGTFGAVTSVVTPSITQDIYAIDLNNDGALDLVTSNSAANSISTFLNVPAVNNAPTAPTTLYSNNTSAQAGLANPTGLTDTTPAFSAICNDPDSGDILNKYRVQVDDNNDFSSVLWDSGAAGTAMANCVAGARSSDISYGGTPLALDGRTYYWRIKFWDDSNAEGVFSQTISTNTFTMAQQGASIQRVSSNTVPIAPDTGQPQTMNAGTIRWYFTDRANNETGFRLYDAQGALLAAVSEANITYIEETGLSANTEYSGRVIKAFNNVGESSGTAFASFVTPMPEVTATVLSATSTTLTVTTSPELPNLSLANSAVQFDLLDAQATGLNAAAVLNSGWVQTLPYTFTDLQQDRPYQIRVKTRNQSGTETSWSPFLSVSTTKPETPSQPQFTLAFDLRTQDGTALPALLDPRGQINGQITIRNIGQASAHNVFVNMPLPTYVLAVQDSLRVGAAAQTAAADVDPVQADRNAVSAIWAEVAAGQEKTLQFSLRFDTESLTKLLASANPTVSFQASLSYDESPDIVFSAAVTSEVDLSSLAPAPQEPVPPIEPEVPVKPPSPTELHDIQQVLPSTPTSSSPVAPSKTESSYEGPSFTVNTSSKLTLTGTAFLSGSTLQFTGTTSEPFTVVTLIFDNNVQIIAVSDENGEWQTFVSADRLGIQPGQMRTVDVQAIAAKGDVVSERVAVGEYIITRDDQGVAIHFGETVAGTTIATAITKASRQVTRFVRTQEQPIQTTLGATVPVVVVASAPLWGYLPYLPVLLYHLLSWLVGAAGTARKGKRFYGIVYDSISKEPVALAILRIRDQQGRLVATRVTDHFGRYEALLPAGTFTLEVIKPGYVYPSQIVQGMQDAGFEHVYRPENGVTGGLEWLPDVPVDPVNASREWQVASMLKKCVLAFRKAGSWLAVPVLGVGAAASAFLTIVLPQHGINMALTVLYLILLGAQIALRPRLVRAWGKVFDTDNHQALPLVALQLIDTQGKVVSSRLSDYEGRYRFLPNPGSYHIRAHKDGYEQSLADDQRLKADVVVSKPEQAVSGDVGMRPLV